MKVSTLHGSQLKKNEAAAELLQKLKYRPEFLKAGQPREGISTGIREFEQVCSELPRGAISEFWGPHSCGKTSLLRMILAETTLRGELCAIVDAGDCFDPGSAQKGGVQLNRLLWIRCNGKLDLALKAVDLLLHGGGFAVVAFDAAEFPADAMRRIPMMYWFRFRQALENTPTSLIVLAPVHVTGSCGSLVLSGEPGKVRWSGSNRFRLLDGFQPTFEIRRAPDNTPRKSFSIMLKAASGSMYD